MRLLVSYSTSAVIHAGVLAICAVCLPLIRPLAPQEFSQGRPLQVALEFVTASDTQPSDSSDTQVVEQTEVSDDADALDNLTPESIALPPSDRMLDESLTIPPNDIEVAASETALPEPTPQRSEPSSTMPELDSQTFAGKRASPETPATTPPASKVSIPTDPNTGLVDELPRQMPANPTPIYPPDALANKIEGKTLLRVRITAEGTVLAVRLFRSSGNVELDESAAAAVRDWRFSPARRAGHAVEYEVIVPVRFELAHNVP